jgi:quercetin dioxygenase-like cupin family protein
VPTRAARARALEAVAEHEAATIDEGGLRFVRSAQVDWMPGPVAGLELKLLRLDETQQRMTVLARMAPGTTYPSHRHGGLEELYLIEGDLLVGDAVLMRPGDYCSAEPGSIPTGIRTISGCVFVTTQSACDEILT